MRCDDCGCDIPAGQEVETTRSEQTGGPGLTGAHTSTELATLCPACARRRATWGWIIGLAVAITAIGGIAVFITEVVLRK